MSRSLDGLVWCSGWSYPGEGPYTIAAKVLNANDLKTRFFKGVIRWEPRSCASLLDPRPTELAIEPAATLGRILHDASLEKRIPFLYNELANDKELRYCAKCMSTGFQAAIAQIQGLEYCPIHADAHRNTCIRCGTKTPPYCLEEGTKLPGFSCRACGAPFGGDLPIDRRLDAWTSPEYLYRLDPIHRWLETIGNSKIIRWINVSEWSTTRASPEGDDSKRDAVFAVLNTQLPDPGTPESSLAGKSSALGPYPIASNKAAKDLTQAEYDEILRQLTIPTAIRHFRQYLLTPSFGVAVPNDPIVPFELHAHLIWRAQFELVSFTHSQLYSRLEFSRHLIPRLLNTGQNHFELPFGNSTLWEGALKSTWLAALKIAIEWHQMLVSFQQQGLGLADHQWLTSVDRWANRLGCWKDRRYFPVGLIMVADTATGADQLYFVVA